MTLSAHTQGVHCPNTPKNQELLCTLSSQAIFNSFAEHFATNTGWQESDWLGKPLQLFIHPHDISGIKESYRDVLDGETVRFEGVRCLGRDGTYVTWCLSFVPQREMGLATEVLVLGRLANEALPVAGQVIHPLSAFRLNSENGKSSSSTIVEYAGLAKLLEGMLGNAPIGFALFDEELRFICLNQSFSELTGFSPAQHLGKPLRDLLSGVADLVEPVMQNVLASGMPELEFEAELHALTGNETYQHAQMSFYPIPDLHGGVCGVAIIAIDVTERVRSAARLKVTSEELKRSNHALEEFSFIASHDLKEPLRTVSSFVQLLGDRYEGKLDATADEYIGYITGGAKRMQQLIDRILDFSQAGKKQRALTEVNANDVLSTVIKNLNSAIVEKGAKVTSETLPVVQSDESLLNQVFQNLIANALKYSSAVPHIHVSACRELNTWVFSIADNGIGIHSDQFLNIFSPFTKLHSRAEYPGSGLGLAICQRNIERQGGRIWVTSEEGKGSVFSFTIPIPVPTVTAEGRREHENR